MTPAQLTLVSPGATTTEENTSAGRRDRYLDLLRFLALAQLLVLHVVDFEWHPATYPAIGILLAVEASLLAGSLDRSRHRPLPVIKKKVLGLLAPLWALGVVVVPVMIALGWTNTAEGQPLEAASLLNWLIPVTPPPGSDFGVENLLPVWAWFLSAYLWLLLLSPSLLWLFRRWPARTMGVPAALLVFNLLGIAALNGEVGGVVLNLSTFGTCWLLGFAHHDGLLTRLRIDVALAVGVGLYGLGIASALAFPTLDRGPVPAETPVSYALLSAGMVLVLLRLDPLIRGRLGAQPPLTGLLATVNDRALTIYLWGNACVSLAFQLVLTASAQPWWPSDLLEFAWPAVPLALSLILLLICVVSLGWIQDKAAGRPARLNPWPAQLDGVEHRSRRHRGHDAVRDPRQVPTGPRARRHGRHRRRRWNRLGRRSPAS